MTDEVYQIGSIPLTVRPFGKDSVHGVPSPFVALVPATDLTQLPSTLDVLSDLVAAGCTSLILAGPRADTYGEQVGPVLEQHGASTDLQPLSDLSDACNATVFAALIHKAGLALCANELELLETLRGVAQMNGWTLTSDAAKLEDAKKPPGLSDPSGATPAPRAKPAAKAKAATKAKAKAKAKPAAKAKPKTNAKPAAKKSTTKAKPSAKAKAKPRKK
jgi:hypothetical protein